MSHDQLFKTLLKGFFYDFLRLFLPAIAAGIEPERITFLDTTDFTTQPEGDYRVADIVARVDPRDQPPSVVILHTEVETEPEADFPYRMWEYNALLTLEHQPPVISIALLPFMVGQSVELARYTEQAGVLAHFPARARRGSVPGGGAGAGGRVRCLDAAGPRG